MGAFLAASALAGAPGVAWAQDLAQASQNLTIGVGPSPTASLSQRLNPTGRPITLTVPAKDGLFYLGDIVLTISPEDRIEFSSQRLLDVLAQVLGAQAVEQLNAAFTGRPVITPADLEGTGLTATYNPQTLELLLGIPVNLRATRTVAVSPFGGDMIGTFDQPANFAGYLNTRGSLDYVHKGFDVGLQTPVFFLDGALWSHGVALESEGVWQPASDRRDFQRLGSRFVYDDLQNLARWTAGDLRPLSTGFQAAPEMAGISVFRSYSVLEPTRSARPAGDQTFQLARPSTVEIRANGQILRRLRLEPGIYNLRDFPFTQGANDIVVSIEDDTGAQQTLQFNVFFDQTQLEPGLSEFGLFAGLKAPLQDYGPSYQDDFAVTGYFRRGLSQNFTAGANVQFDENSILAGVQGVFGTRIGTFAFNLGASGIRGAGNGYAATVTFQRLFQFVGGQGDSLNLAFTARSEDFGPIGVPLPSNPYDFEFSGGYSHAFNEDLYSRFDASFLKGRGTTENLSTFRAGLGYRLTPEIGVQVDGTYRSSGADEGLGAFISLVYRLSPTSRLRADYDTRNNAARLAYQALSGTGVGAYNINAAVERSDDAVGLNGTANYFANRAEIGASHFTSFDAGLDSVTDQRTSGRVGTAFAFADGAMTVGRPINQAFAIIREHPSLEGADVYVNPSPFGYTASTGYLGTALESNLSAYAPRTITIDAPESPPGYDLGSGTYRVFPPYRAGYLLQAGSDYSVTAIGRLVQANGEPVALLAGQAFEVAAPEREPVTIFTNGQGRFGAAGLKPGQWRIEMPTEPVSVYILDVPEGTVGALRAGDLTPSATGN